MLGGAIPANLYSTDRGVGLIIIIIIIIIITKARLHPRLKSYKLYI